MKKTPLHIAIIEEQIEVASDLIVKGADVNAKDSNKSTPLHLAIEMRNINLIKQLIEAGADISFEDSYYMTPLKLAITSRSVNVLKLLLDAGVDVNARDSDDFSPLYWAALYGNSSIVKLLLDAGASVNPRNKSTKNTPLHNAVDTENVHIVKLLLGAGANVNAIGDKGFTPLRQAISLENLNISKVLLQACADPNLTDDKGNTPLDVAVEFLNVDILNLLVDAGANVNKFNTLGETPVQALVKNLELKRPRQENNLIKKMIECTEVNLIDEKRKNVLSKILELDLSPRAREYFKKIIIRRIATLEALNIELDSGLLFTIHSSTIRNNYFTMCVKELEVAKRTLLRLRHKNRWVTFFDFLVKDEYKLLKHEKYEDLEKDTSKDIKKFLVYGATMQINIRNGFRGLELFNNAKNFLSFHLPIFRDNLHCTRIIEDILDVINEQGWEMLSE